MKKLNLLNGLIVLFVMLVGCKKEGIELAPIVNFELSTDTALVYDTVRCFNLSDDAQTFVWNFGDNRGWNNHLSIETNPYHIYYYPGNYQIKLTVINDHVERSVLKNIVIEKRFLTGYWYGWGNAPVNINLYGFVEYLDNGVLANETTIELGINGNHFEYDVSASYDEATNKIEFSCWKFSFTGTYDGDDRIEGTLSIKEDRDFSGDYKALLYRQY